MSFMYLHLYAGNDGQIRVEVKNSGSFNSLGTSTSQDSRLPSSIVRVASFTGLSAIEDSELLEELMRRVTTRELMQRLSIRLSDSELIEMLRERLHE